MAPDASSIPGALDPQPSVTSGDAVAGEGPDLLTEVVALRQQLAEVQASSILLRNQKEMDDAERQRQGSRVGALWGVGYVDLCSVCLCTNV